MTSRVNHTVKPSSKPTRLADADFMLLLQSLNNYYQSQNSQFFLDCFEVLNQIYNSHLLLKAVQKILKIYPKQKVKQVEVETLLFAKYPQLKPQNRSIDLFVYTPA